MIDPATVHAALPGYDLGDEIGRGGWGIVFQARQRSLGRTVAIKHLPAAQTEAPLNRFVEEAQVVSRLDHPHIVDVYDFVEYQGHGFIIMEFVSGGSVWDVFRTSGIDSDDAVVIGLAVASALETAHAQRVIHRDVKPDNVLLTGAGDARLTDFGNLAGIGFGRAHTTDLIGTPAYMSPEQIEGEPLTPASDVYNLGIMMYELLSGTLPYAETTDRAQLRDQRFNQAPMPLPDHVAPATRDVVMSALVTDPSQRIGSAESFGVQLAAAATSWFGTDWIRHARGDLLDNGRIGNAARVSGSVTAAAPSQLVKAGLVQPHLRTGTVVQPGAPQTEQTQSPTTDAESVAVTTPPTPPPVEDFVTMNNAPGPPPGAPSLGVPEVVEPAKSTGPKKLAIVLVLGFGVLVMLMIGALALFVLTGGDTPLSAEYCATTETLQTALDTSGGGDIEKLRAAVNDGGSQAPADIVNSWTRLAAAIEDLTTPGAAAEADAATASIFRHAQACP
ncbi:MAG: serine/threonine protein kinase [Acidimicrobiales bacterium]